MLHLEIVGLNPRPNVPGRIGYTERSASVTPTPRSRPHTLLPVTPRQGKKKITFLITCYIKVFPNKIYHVSGQGQTIFNMIEMITLVKQPTVFYTCQIQILVVDFNTMACLSMVFICTCHKMLELSFRPYILHIEII